MKYIIISVMCVAITSIGGCVYTGLSGLDWLKANSPAKLEKMGFTCVYEACTMGDGIPFSSDHGSVYAWWFCRRIPDNGVTYTCFTYRWGDEIRVYNMRAIDAIRP